MSREIKHKILIVDDDPLIRQMLSLKLDNRFKIIECADGKSAAHLGPSAKPDLVLLDLMLPDLSGREVLKILRTWYQGPIIIISTHSADKDIIELLTLGANDYVIKPFNFDVLLARIVAHLRLSSARDSGLTMLENGELRIDLDKHEISVRGQKMDFTPKEYDLLRHFIINKGKMLTHRDILKEVWGPAHTRNTQYLRTYIGQIRDKIEKDPANPAIIITEPRIGYRMETV